MIKNSVHVFGVSGLLAYTFFGCADLPSGLEDPVGNSTSLGTGSQVDVDSAVQTHLIVSHTPSVGLEPVYITCDVAREIDARWDKLVDEVSSCFFGGRNSSHGVLNSTQSSCSLGNRSLELIPPLDSLSPVLFGDDFKHSQTVVLKMNGNECFSLTRKADLSNSNRSLVRVSQSTNVLFETSIDSNNFHVQMSGQNYYLPLDSKTLSDFSANCGVNISGRWGSDHVFYGPQSILTNVTFHMSKSNQTRFDSTCDVP